MLTGFTGFIVSTKPDLYFKMAMNIMVVVLMTVSGLRIKGQRPDASPFENNGR